MSKKKKKQRAERIQVIKQEISVQDDPYWRVPRIYMDAHRVGRFISRFERFEDLHPEWTEDLFDGTPTYYCVLGVERGATKDRIEQAYERKLNFSSYPDDVIEEAYDVLSNPGLQKMLVSVSRRNTPEWGRYWTGIKIMSFYTCMECPIYTRLPGLERTPQSKR